MIDRWRRVSGLPGRLWRWIRGQIVQDVPDDLALCEFDCRQQQCRDGDWDGCARRASGAAGTLSPEGRGPFEA